MCMQKKAGSAAAVFVLLLARATAFAFDNGAPEPKLHAVEGRNPESREGTCDQA